MKERQIWKKMISTKLKIETKKRTNEWKKEFIEKYKNSNKN